MKRQIICIFLAAASVYSARQASAQDIIDHAPLRSKYEAVNWDKVSLPPSDPYELSYSPARPERALDILDAESCKAQGGEWPAKVSYNEIHDLYGCKINNSPVGRWVFVVKTEVKGNNISVIPDKAVNGYLWYVDGKIEGESVQFQSPEKAFLKTVVEYSAGEIDGNELEWGENGQLIYYNHYIKGEMDGETARFNSSASPEYYGTYLKGKPTETWYIFHPMFAGLQYKKEYTKAVPEDLKQDLGAYERVVWTVEYDVLSGKKRIEGYRLERTDSDPAIAGTMYGTQTFYDSNGEKWLDVHFKRDGILDDSVVMELCKGYEDYNFDHNERVVNCVDQDDETGKSIRYYSTGEIRYIEERKTTGDIESWTHTEFHKNGENLTEPKAYNFKRYKLTEVDEGDSSDRDVPDGEIVFLAQSGAEGAQRVEYAKNLIKNENGTWVAYWYNGNIREKGAWNRGKKEGRWEYYDENGAKVQQTEYKNGEKSGTEETWFADGMPDQIKNYTDGMPNGSFKGYYTLGGLAWEATYKLEQRFGRNIPRLAGHYREYSGTGALTKDEDFTKTNASGEYSVTLYYSNGNIRAKGYDSGISESRDGEWKLYLLDGTYWRDVTYENGVAVSESAAKCGAAGGEYIIDEEKRVEGCYLSMVNREVVTHPDKLRYGAWKWWDERGALQRVGEFSLGHFDGHWAYYYPGGKPGVEPDPNYIMLEGDFSLDRPVGVWRGYYIGNKPKFDGRYDVNGKETGLWTTYYENGEKSSFGEFEEGKRVGAWVWHFENGKIKDEGAYVDGLEEGKWITYYENGQKYGEGEFKAGKRQGKWTWWREDGTEWRNTNYIDGKDQSMK